MPFLFFWKARVLISNGRFVLCNAGFFIHTDTIYFLAIVLALQSVESLHLDLFS